MSHTSALPAQKPNHAHVVWIALLLLLISLIPNILHNWGNRPKISTTSLFPEQTMLVGAFQTPPFSGPVIWQESKAPNLFEETIMMSTSTIESHGHRIQFSGGSALEMDQMVLQFGGAAFAWWQFLQAQPGVYDSAFQFTPLTLDDLSTHADQQRATCATVDQRGCAVAYVWARYGQYLIRIRVAADETPIDAATIRAIFSAIDQHIAATLDQR